MNDLAFGPLANTCHNLFHFQWQEATTHQPGTMLAILGSSRVCGGVGMGGMQTVQLNHAIAFWHHNAVNLELFAHPYISIPFRRCSWNLIVTQCVKAPGTNNGGSDWSQHHCFITALLWGVAGTLGTWPRWRWKEKELATAFTPVSPPHPLLSSSQTDLQLECELWGEEASLFLWASLYPLRVRVNVYIQHGISRLLVYDFVNVCL